MWLSSVPEALVDRAVRLSTQTSSMDNSTFDITAIEDAHQELWNMGTIEVWPQPRPGDSFVCTFTPRENILMRVLRKQRLVKPAELISVQFVVGQDGHLTECAGTPATDRTYRVPSPFFRLW